MISRLLSWSRRHWRLVDLLLILPLVPISVALHALTFSWSYEQSLGPLDYAMSVLTFVPLVWRRRWPRAVFAAVCVITFVMWFFHDDLAGVDVAGDVAILVAIYTVATQCVFGWSLAALLVTDAAVFLAILPMGGVWTGLGIHLAFSWVLFGSAWLFGLYIRTRRKYILSLEERAERLERERDAQAEIAAAAERARIARELHDVIAHSIGIMVIQSDGASYAVDTDAELAKQATQTIGDIGRQALMEMRRMLGVLREEDADAGLAPQPDLEQLPNLVEQIRAAGVPVEYTVSGEPVSLPAGLELVVFRIVQEALTNVMKHAGPGATARVSLDYGDRSIHVCVRDDGCGVSFSGGNGHGLVGMRERAAVYGGEVRAAPAPGGGFEVVAWLPVEQKAT